MPRRSANRSSQPAWLLPLVVITVCLLSGLPLARLLYAGLRFSLEGKATGLFSEPSTWFAIRNTLMTATGGMVISVVLGASFAFVVTLTDIRAKGFFSFAFVLPMMIPPQVDGAGLGADVRAGQPAVEDARPLRHRWAVHSRSIRWAGSCCSWAYNMRHWCFWRSRQGLQPCRATVSRLRVFPVPRRCGYFATSSFRWPCPA